MFRIERKLVDHAEAVMSKRTGTINDTARSYNARCKEMRELILRRKAPPNAVAPEPLDVKTLYSLDVEDALWQDVGLEEEHGEEVPAPRWLADDATRRGIKAVLSRDRSMEEQSRLRREKSNMQMWLKEEWERLERAMGAWRGKLITIRSWRLILDGK